ncbi:MAG TPA: hypothetical protein VHR72_06980, partial [Gemmataceae bacterium]|nr:hypothetical protein [Gemmataceae bacterium]
ITFSKFTAKLTVRQYLDLAVQQLPGDASYIVRGGLVVVAPAKSLKLDRLLHRRITIDLRGKSVVEALEAVADLSGVSIVVDRRCSDAPAALVELRTNNDMSVRGILESIADTHDLKIIVDAHRVTVMPQTAYLKRLRDQAEEAAALRGIEK